VDHHISIAGPDVGARPENHEQSHGREKRHEESDQNQGRAWQRRRKLIEAFPVLRRLIPLSRLTIVVTRRRKVRLFAWLRLGGSRLEFGYIVCHAVS
jgi:hypothetical protein